MTDLSGEGVTDGTAQPTVDEPVVADPVLTPHGLSGVWVQVTEELAHAFHQVVHPDPKVGSHVELQVLEDHEGHVVARPLLDFVTPVPLPKDVLVDTADLPDPDRPEIPTGDLSPAPAPQPPSTGLTVGDGSGMAVPEPEPVVVPVPSPEVPGPDPAVPATELAQ